MLRFDPPENATNAEKCPGPGWISCGWQMFDKWRDGRGYREIARDLGCSAGNLTLWKQGRVPLKVYLEKLEQIADVPPIAWQWWICADPDKMLDEDPWTCELTIDNVRAALNYARANQPPADDSGVACCLLTLALLETRGRLNYSPETDELAAALLADVGAMARDMLRLLCTSRKRPLNGSKNAA